MRKPNNTPKELSRTLDNFNLEEMTIAEVDALHRYMIENNVIRVFLTDQDYGGYQLSMETRLETYDEAEARYQKELKIYEKEIQKIEKLKINKLAKLKKDAADLGYTINEIQTNKSKGKSKTK